MTQLPAALEGFASLLDAQPQPVREMFQYCLCQMLVEAGTMCLVNKVAGEAGAICVFESAVGEPFSVVRPPITQEQEAAMVGVLREILRDEGLL